MKREAIEKALTKEQPTRSAWSRGVYEYARDLLSELEERHGGELPDRLDEEDALNGAKDWTQYSYYGLALIYNEDIAQRLCTPSEYKRTHGGLWAPNSREDWRQVQGRALWQAFRALQRAYTAAQR